MARTVALIACVLVCVGVAYWAGFAFGRENGIAYEKGIVAEALNRLRDDPQFEPVAAQPSFKPTWNDRLRAQNAFRELQMWAPAIRQAAENPNGDNSAFWLSWWENNRPRLVAAMGEKAVEEFIPSSSIPRP